MSHLIFLQIESQRLCLVNVSLLVSRHRESLIDGGLDIESEKLADGTVGVHLKAHRKHVHNLVVKGTSTKTNCHV